VPASYLGGVLGARGGKAANPSSRTSLASLKFAQEQTLRD